MANIIKELYEKKLTNLGGNNWIKDNIQYITIMGSVAYGVSSDTSDCDLYSFCIPPIKDLFPHLKGEIVGFAEAKDTNNRFRNFHQHHIKDVDEKKQYDICVYNIVDYFQLVMENNPNMIDSLFTPENCVLFSTRVGQIVRENRKKFLHKGSWHTFKGYAYQQLKKSKPTYSFYCIKCDDKYNDSFCTKCKIKLSEKVLNTEGKRKELVEKFGYDVKYAYHLVRLLNEVEQIMVEGDIDLKRNNDQLKSIRRGEWKLEEIESYFSEKEKQLEKIYNESKLPWGPKDGPQELVRKVLFQCIEEHYGSIDKYINLQDTTASALREINEVLVRYRNHF